MHPIFFSIGSFTVRFYGVMAALGFLVAMLLVRVNRRYANLTADQAVNMVMFCMISGVIGARIFYVIQNWHYYRTHMFSMVRIDQGGLVFYGGFILAVLVLISYARRIKADWVRVCDVFTPALAFAHALGRIGCFLNGCCFGKPAEGCFWAVVYPAGSEPFRRYGALPLHPVQLYEAGLNILLGLLLWFLLRHTRRGVTMSVYVLAYGLLRFLDEFFRGDHTRLLEGFTPAQVIGFGLIPLGVVFTLYFSLRKAPAA